MRCRSTHKLISALATMLPCIAIAQQNLVGLSVDEAIRRSSEGGLRVYYSSDLVRPTMTISEQPAARDPIAQLTEILAPHGLMLRPGFNDSWLVTRQPAAGRVIPVTPPERTEISRRAIDALAPMPIEQVVVTASRYEIQGANVSPLISLSDVELEFAPDLGDDAIRAVARLPGVSSNGISALANVRGGEINETIVRLDDVLLYDPFHLRDFQRIFSVIDPHVVDSMDVYTGAYPVQFGDRMSGVIDIETISPPDNLYHEIGLSFFNSSLLSAGRFADDRGEWVVSARRSNIDLLYDRFSDQPERPQYNDAFAKLGMELGDKLSVTANFFHANDTIELADDVDREERARARQTDTYGWLRMDHALSAQMIGVTLLSSTEVTSSRSGSSEKTGVSSGRLQDDRSFSVDTVRSEWSRIVGARFMLDFGGEFSSFDGRYDYEDEAEFDLLFDVAGAPAETSHSNLLSLRPSGHQYSVFAAVRFDPNDRLAAEFGLRLSRQDLAGLISDTHGPRLGLRYRISDSMALRASAGRFFQPQGINELQINDGIDRFFRPQQADHFVLGLDRRLASGVLLRIEAYCKDMTNLRPRFENLLNARVLLPELKPDRIRIAPDSAEARGLEVSLDGESGSFHWWGNLAWARFEDRLKGLDVLRSWDQTYTFNAGFLWQVGRWSVSSGIVYRSGWPTTDAMLDTTASFPTASAGQRNGARMRPYRSLDMRLSRAFELDNSKLDLFIELTNLTGHFNPCCIEYEVGDEEDAGELVLDERAYFKTVPSVGLTWTF